jgi:hypothetical protein
VVISGSNLLGGGAFFTQITLAGYVVTLFSSPLGDFVFVIPSYSSAGTIGKAVVVSNTGSIVNSSADWTFDIRGEMVMLF